MRRELSMRMKPFVLCMPPRHKVRLWVRAAYQHFNSNARLMPTCKRICVVPVRISSARVIEFPLGASDFPDSTGALIPPPRKRQHRYFAVLVPNSPWRALVMAQAG